MHLFRRHCRNYAAAFAHIDRLMFYGCSLVRNQVGRGDEIYELQPVYVLCIANYCRKHESETPGKLLFSYQFREEETNELFGNQTFCVFPQKSTQPLASSFGNSRRRTSLLSGGCYL